jgi:hypothetical protein
MGKHVDFPPVLYHGADVTSGGKTYMWDAKTGTHRVVDTLTGAAGPVAQLTDRAPMINRLDAAAKRKLAVHKVASALSKWGIRSSAAAIIVGALTGMLPLMAAGFFIGLSTGVSSIVGIRAMGKATDLNNDASLLRLQQNGEDMGRREHRDLETDLSRQTGAAIHEHWTGEVTRFTLIPFGRHTYRAPQLRARQSPGAPSQNVLG